jgi:hypothetical protein
MRKQMAMILPDTRANSTNTRLDGKCMGIANGGVKML